MRIRRLDNLPGLIRLILLESCHLGSGPLLHGTALHWHVLPFCVGITNWGQQDAPGTPLVEFQNHKAATA